MAKTMDLGQPRSSAEFCKERQAECEKYAKDYPHFEADWDAIKEYWLLGRADGKDASEQYVKTLKTEAILLANELGHITPGCDPLESCLNAIRERCSDGKRWEWGYREYAGGWVVNKENTLHENTDPGRRPSPSPQEVAEDVPLTDSQRLQLRDLTNAALAVHNKGIEDSLDRGVPNDAIYYTASGTIQNVFHAFACFWGELAADRQLEAAQARVAATILPHEQPYGTAANETAHPSETEQADSITLSRSEPARSSKLRHRKALRNDPLFGVKALVRQLKKEGSTHEQICKRLGDQPRPPGAQWHVLTWPVAYKKHRGSVDKWLSKHCPPEKASSLKLEA